LMERQSAISADRLHRKIGRVLTVLVDAIDEEGVAIARSTADAPEIDGVVYIEDGAKLPVGEFVQVRIVDADEHDLYAEIGGA
jgi:ribosomal protein S12 methylthiotransferase